MGGIVVSITAVSLGVSPSAGAQAPADPDEAVCYGFSFGRWSPALDRAAAGHDPAAPGGPTTLAATSCVEQVVPFRSC